MIPGDKVKTKVVKFGIPADIIGFVYDVNEDTADVVFDCLDESGVSEKTLHYCYYKNELELMYNGNTTWRPNTDRSSRPKDDCEAFVIVEAVEDTEGNTAQLQSSEKHCIIGVWKHN